MDALKKKLRHLAAHATSAIEADRALYTLVIAYTLLGLAFVHAVGAGDRVAYAVYVWRWVLMFLVVMPVVALTVDTMAVIHRFDARRGLVFRRVFSAQRMGRFAAGLALLMAMMVFQGTFTSVKNALPVWQGGFPHDRIQADIDAFIHFGVDPWRLLFAVAESETVLRVLEWNYGVAWFLLCYGALAFVATSPKADTVRVRYFVCFMLVWALVGNVLAGIFLSAGPVYYGPVVGDEARFGEQLAFLAATADLPNSAAGYQAYLWTLYAQDYTGFGSGISAFPSVHVGLAAMNAAFLWDHDRRLGIVAWLYVAIIQVSSVYLAWHYAIDGYAAIAVVLVVHVAVRRLMSSDVWPIYQPSLSGRRQVGPGRV